MGFWMVSRSWSLSWGISGPVTAMLLADHGAR